MSILMTCVMNNSVRIPFRSYFELRATQELFSEIVNITHTTLKKHKDSLECTMASLWKVVEHFVATHHVFQMYHIFLGHFLFDQTAFLDIQTHIFHLLAYLLSLLGRRYWRTEWWTNIASLVFYVNVLCLWVM